MEAIENIGIFNFLAGAASILSLLISLFALRQVYNVKNQLNLDLSQRDNQQSIKGSKNIQIGRDINA